MIPAYIWVIVICILAIYALYLFAIKDVHQIDKMFPGPFALPLIGNALQALGDSEKMYKNINIYSDYYKETFRVWFAHKAYVLINKPEDAEAILSSSMAIEKADEYDFITPWIGFGLLISGGEKWRKHRKMLTPAFHFKILDRFVEIFQTNSEILCEKLAEQEGCIFDVYELIKLYALDNICETAMGTKINAQKYPQSAYVQAIKRVCVVIYYQMFRLWYRSQILFHLSPHGATMRKCLKVLHGTTDEVIKSRKEELKNNGKLSTQKIEDEEFYSKKKMAFLDILLQAAHENGLSDEDIRAEVDTFMFEGHDTITSGISFAIYNLAENPDVQDKVFQEQQLIFGNDKRSPTHRDLQEMKYLEQVIKESLRLYPSVPIIGRRLYHDVPLREGVYIPKGVQVVILIAAIHRNRKIWDNPDEFNPENFSPESQQKRHPYAFLPFSAGPRNCIGQRFAILEMKSALSNIIRRFEVLPCLDSEDKPQIKTELVLNSKNGVKIRIRSRKLASVE